MRHAVDPAGVARLQQRLAEGEERRALETPPLDAIPERGDVLLGYSMGGRLALRKLAGYKRAVIVSARISVPEPNRADWAPRFASDEWDTLMRDWNAQPIFGGHVMPRDECDFDRLELVR